MSIRPMRRVLIACARDDVHQVVDALRATEVFHPLARDPARVRALDREIETQSLFDDVDVGDLEALAHAGIALSLVVEDGRPGFDFDARDDAVVLGDLAALRKAREARDAVVDGACEDGDLVALAGFVPEADLERVLAVVPACAAVIEGAPDEDDSVPVALDNPLWLRGFERIVRAFSGVDYFEPDVTWSVGALFVVFGALCLLDAGYGLCVLAIGLFLHARKQHALAFVADALGVVSVALGAMVGQVFGFVVGVHILKSSTPLLPLASDPRTALTTSLWVGAGALIFAHALAIRRRGFRSHATGSLLVVVGAALVLVDVRIAVAVLCLAALLLVAFPDPVFGQGARAANALWTLYATATGVTGDVLSHMRLFGIALSGSILAVVVNELGAPLPLWARLLASVVGHVAVFLLAMLSLAIHVNRLIFLEVGQKHIDGGQIFFEPITQKKQRKPS